MAMANKAKRITIKIFKIGINHFSSNLESTITINFIKIRKINRWIKFKTLK